MQVRQRIVFTCGFLGRDAWRMPALTMHPLTRIVWVSHHPRWQWREEECSLPLLQVGSLPLLLLLLLTMMVVMRRRKEKREKSRKSSAIYGQRLQFMKEATAGEVSVVEGKPSSIPSFKTLVALQVVDDSLRCHEENRRLENDGHCQTPCNRSE